jgi:hypothetical protein
MMSAPLPSDSDLMTIRAAINRWSGSVQLVDAEGRKQELAEREGLVAALLRLLAISHAREAGGDSVRPVQAVDVERVLSCFRRLTLLGVITPVAVAEYCEKAAAGDDNVIAHRADPLSLRYVLTYHLESTRAWFAGKNVDRLRYVCERADLASIRAWFESLAADKGALPKDSGQYVRSLLLQFWNRRMGDLETLAFEQAVLEVRLFSTIGWENTRMFCALLRKIGGGNRSAFAAYLTADDITEALTLHEVLGQADQCAHFRALAAVHDTQLIGQLEHAVLATAAHADEQAASRTEPLPVVAEVPATSAETPARQSRLRRLFGFKEQTA